MVDGRDLRRVAHDATVHSGHGGGGERDVMPSAEDGPNRLIKREQWMLR